MEQLLTRDGAEFTGTPTIIDGKPVRLVPVACHRCHVIGGQRLWVMGTENGQPYSRTGFDCWTCGNSGVRGERKERLYTAQELARVMKAAATREARKAEAARIAREQFELAEAARRAEFTTDNAAFIADLESLDGEFWEGFRSSFMERACAPTERQIALVRAAVAKRAADAASKFVGRVGDKVTLAITVERILTLHDKVWGNNYITIGRTSEGSVVVYKGRVDIGQVGDTVTIKATVKDHQTYNGVRQTAVQRPTVL